MNKIIDTLYDFLAVGLLTIITTALIFGLANIIWLLFS